ncbi:hypothetical protein ATCC90586_000646 [Pythium insidiosum]|nr:hypothetical protein ATCC90586_000646 [Pythium insidiosum]
MAAPDLKNCLDALQSVLTDDDFSDCMLRSGLRIPARASARADAIRSACDVPDCEDLAARLAHADLLSCPVEPFVSMEFVAKSCHFRLQREEPMPRAGCWTPPEPAVAPRVFQTKRFLARSNRTSDSSSAGSRANATAGSDFAEPRNSPAPAPPPEIRTAAPAFPPSTRTPSTPAPTRKKDTTTKTNDDSESNSPAPIIIGVVAGVVVILLLVWYVRRRQRRDRDRKSATDPEPTARDAPFPDHTLTTELLSKTHGTTHTSSTQASSATISSHSEEVTVHRQAFHATATSALSDPELSQMRVSMLELLLRIALHIVDALVYLHSRQPPVLHRDLKSRNVLLSTQHDAKLIDFGVSRERGDQTMTAGVGTLRWMAPEVMQGGRYSDKADIFSFGVLLSELDTHRIPYNVDGAPMNDLVIITQVSMGHLKVDFSPEADNKIVRLARACMAFEAKKRPSAEQVLQILASFVEGDTIYAI